MKIIRATKISLLPTECATMLFAACSTVPMRAPVPDTPLSGALRCVIDSAAGGDTVNVRWRTFFGDPVLAA